MAQNLLTFVTKFVFKSDISGHGGHDGPRSHTQHIKMHHLIIL